MSSKSLQLHKVQLINHITHLPYLVIHLNLSDYSLSTKKMAIILAFVYGSFRVNSAEMMHTKPALERATLTSSCLEQVINLMEFCFQLRRK